MKTKNEKKTKYKNGNETKKDKTKRKKRNRRKGNKQETKLRKMKKILRGAVTALRREGAPSRTRSEIDSFSFGNH